MNNRYIAESIWEIVKSDLVSYGLYLSNQNKYIDAITQALDEQDNYWADDIAKTVAEATQKIRKAEKNLTKAQAQITTLRGALEGAHDELVKVYDDHYLVGEKTRQTYLMIRKALATSKDTIEEVKHAE